MVAYVTGMGWCEVVQLHSAIATCNVATLRPLQPSEITEEMRAWRQTGIELTAELKAKL